MALLDADGDQALGRFVDEVETVRSGYILARDPKAYGTWRRDVDRKSGRKPEGKGLADLSRDLGGNVLRGEFEFRN